MIPYGRQSISEDDIKAVEEVLRSDYLTQGPTIERFERAVADKTQAKFGVAASSATACLHIACLALELGEGDLLWTAPNTFVASANVGLYCGAEVDFVDIDPQTYVMCADALAVKLEAANKAGRLPKIVMPVQFAGQCADMKRINALCKQYGIKIIEDASHAIGAQYDSAPVGNCAYSDITVFSFHPVKIITTAEGGLATTQNPDLAQKMQLFRSHGVTREQALLNDQSQGGWYYEQIALGLNYRMTELQAALGLSQLTRLEEFVARRNQLANRYDEILSELNVTTPARAKDCYSAFHLYPILVDARAHVFKKLRDNGIGVNVHYIPVHTQPFWRDLRPDCAGFPNAENYYEKAISIPLHQSLSEEQQDEVVAQIAAALG